MLTAANARGMSPPAYAIYWMIVSVVCAALLGVVGGLVLWRARHHWFGWFTAHVLLFLIGYPLVQPLQVAQLLPVFWIEIGALSWPLFILYFFLFPNGRAVPRSARWPVGVAVVIHFLAQLAGLLASIHVVPASILESMLSPLEFLISAILIFALVRLLSLWV